MKVLVCVLSSRDSIVDAIRKQKERLIPQDLFKKKQGPDYPVNFKVSTFDPSEETISFDKFLLSESKGMDAVILLVENHHAHLILNVANAVFAAIFEAKDGHIENFKNFFGSYFSPLFRNFFAVKKLMSDSEKEQAMMLPLRNFEAAELLEMARLARDESIAGNLILAMETCVAGIIKRRVPRKRSEYKTKYFIDDKKLHFEYGFEHHSLPGTGKPHVAACAFNANFRFGKKIDATKHYNASYGDGDKTYAFGDFPDCHDGVKKVTKGDSCTHVNMFANDFC